jgi:hypothetical protein
MFGNLGSGVLQSRKFGRDVIREAMAVTKDVDKTFMGNQMCYYVQESKELVHVYKHMKKRVWTKLLKTDFLRIATDTTITKHKNPFEISTATAATTTI